MSMIRIFVAVVVAAAVTGAPAYAQQKTGEKKPRNIAQEKAEEDAYRSAVERIPNSSDKYDPWAIARPVPEPAAQKKKKQP